MFDTVVQLERSRAGESMGMGGNRIFCRSKADNILFFCRIFLNVKDGLLSDYYWTSTKCAFSYAEELGMPNMVCQGIMSVELIFWRCIFFVSHFFKNALSLFKNALSAYQKAQTFVLRTKHIDVLKGSNKKVQEKNLIFCSYVLVNFAFLLKPECVSPLFSEGKNVSDWIIVCKAVWVLSRL